MPVKRCKNGKYQIGNGPCIFGTAASAERAFRWWVKNEQSHKKESKKENEE